MRRVTQEELQKTHSLINDINNGKASYYELLGIDNKAVVGDITKAYKSMAVKFHPDKIVSLYSGLPKEEQEKIINQANDITKMLTAANSVLMNDEQRKQYDLKLSVQGQSSQAADSVWTHGKSQDILSIIRGPECNNNVLSNILNQQNLPKEVLVAIAGKISGKEKTEETLLKLLEYQSDVLKFRDPDIINGINKNTAMTANALTAVASKITNPSVLSILNKLDKCDDAVRLAIAKNPKCSGELAKTLLSGGIKDSKILLEAAQNLTRNDNADARRVAIQTLASPPKTNVEPPISSRQSARSRVTPSQKSQDAHQDAQTLSKNPEISLLQVIDRIVLKIENDKSLDPLKKDILAAKDATQLNDILLSEQKSDSSPVL